MKLLLDADLGSFFAFSLLMVKVRIGEEKLILDLYLGETASDHNFIGLQRTVAY